jgi:glycosyltransferase involved in cell wall biosynthesis
MESVMTDELVKLNKPVIIMPIHLKSVFLYHALSEAGVRVLGFWDNDKSLNGKTYDGIKISLPVQAESLQQDVTFIICFKKYEKEIQAQLESLSYNSFVSSQTFEVYMNRDRLNSYLCHVNKTDLHCIEPDYISKFNQLWISSDCCVSIGGLSIREYSKTINSLICDEGRKRSGKSGRKVLLLPHDLSYNGAMVAIENVAHVLMTNGDIPVFANKHNGPYLQELINRGISIIIDYKLDTCETLPALAEEFDLVIVNTILGPSIQMIELLSDTKVPVFWWIHEACRHYLAYKPPRRIGQNIHIYCAWEYARQAFLKANLHLTSGVLLCGMEDYNHESNFDSLVKVEGHELIFMMIGSIQHRKGQDIFCDAVRKLDDHLREQCKFVFIGESHSDGTYDEMLALKHDYPEAVILAGLLSRDEVYEAIKESGYMVCASRDEPGPLFIVEAMIFNKICICSENTGIASFITDNYNGFVYNNNDPEQLSDKMRYVIENHENLHEIKQRSREIYDAYFSMKVFRKNLLDIIDTIC